MRRLIIYQKNLNKPIIITDSDKQPLEELIEQTKKLFISDKIFVMKTDTDCLIGRPSELQSILITSDKKELDLFDNEKIESNDKKQNYNNHHQTDKSKVDISNDLSTTEHKEKVDKELKQEEIVKDGIIKIIPTKASNVNVKPQPSNKKVMGIDEIKEKIKQKNNHHQIELEQVVNDYKNNIGEE